MSLTRITTKEAKTYIPLEENYGNTDLEYAKFFTLTPIKRGNGWETVTYYTDKKYGLYSDKGDGDQWVYILSNPTSPGLLKIVGVEVRQENTSGEQEFAPARKMKRDVLQIGDES